VNFKRSSTIISGFFAVGIYILLLLLLVFYFNAREKIKPIHYVKKNEDKIRVSLASEPIKPEIKSPKVSKPIATKKETVKKVKDTRKKVIKEKIVKKVKPKKKPKEKPKEKPKKVNKPKSLFENIKTSKKPKEKPKKQEKLKAKNPKFVEKPKKKSASEILSESMKVQKASDRGAKNSYLAGAEEKLKQGWYSQSSFIDGIGQAFVRIKVSPSGHFTFKILKYSSNPNFNTLLKAYLEQYQKIGLGRHKGNRPYDIDVEFEAKE